jgi:hypothetical protein
LGFLIAKHHAAVIGAIVARRHASLAWSLAIAACLYLFSWTSAGGYFIGDYNQMTPLYKVLIFALAWTTILAAVGYAAVHLGKGSPALTWLNRKIFPLYIVHQTVVVAALFYVLPLGLGVWTEYLLVAAATVAGSLLFAILADLLPSPLKPLVGLSDRPSRSASRKPAGAEA